MLLLIISGFLVSMNPVKKKKQSKKKTSISYHTLVIFGLLLIVFLVINDFICNQTEK